MSNELKDYPEEYLGCRFQRTHPLGRPKIIHRGSYVHVLWKCRECPLEREDVYDSRGRRIQKPIYTRPKNYGIKGGVDREEVVMEFFRRHRG